MLEIDRIYLGDCLELMNDITDKSIDCVICDLPYGTTQNKWDIVIPLDTLWKEYKRIVKPNGAIVLTSQGIFTANLIVSNLKMFKYKWVWEKSKSTNFLNAKKQPLRKHEDVCVFYVKQPVYNPQMIEGEPYDKGMRKDQLSGSYGDFHSVHVQSDGMRYPTDIIYFKTSESEGKVIHPTQKPVELIRYLIRTYTNEGDLILDNCIGSGTTAIAAIKEKRHFIGMELNKEYYDIACERIKKEQEEIENSLFNM